MRTAIFGSLSDRDRAAIKERREFERQENERQRVEEDRVEYGKYVQTVRDDQQRVPPAYRIEPISFETWRAYADPSISEPVLRGARATHSALLSKVRRDEADDAKAGKFDSAFEIPESAKSLRMTVREAEQFAQEQAELFVSHNPDYYPAPGNFQAISKYLSEQTTVVIPNEECFRLAWLRLRDLGMIEERPEPAREPESVQQPSETAVEPEFVDGFDPVTGQPRQYISYEVHRMSADQYRRAFRVSPKFTRGYFGERP